MKYIIALALLFVIVVCKVKELTNDNVYDVIYSIFN